MGKVVTSMIGFVIPFKKESEVLREKVLNSETFSESGLQFIAGDIAKRPVCFVHSGMGNKKSQKACEELIRRFSPKVIVHFGIAGALSKTLKVGDLVFATSINGQAFSTPPTNFLNFEKVELHKGDIRSVDFTVLEKKRAEDLQIEYQSLAVDCESQGIFWACKANSLPFVSLRAISDMADEKSSDEWKTHIHQLASSLSTAVLSGLNS